MKNRYGSLGFGLIEVLIALIILGVGLLGVALFANSIFSDSADSKSRSEAIALAQERIEQVRALASEVELVSLASDSLVTVASTAQGINTTFTITPSVLNTTSSAFGFNVTVDWLSSDNQTQNVTLSTYITDDLLGATSTLSGLSGGGTNPYAIQSPSGQAEYGVDAPGGVLPEQVRVDNELLSTKVQQSGSGVKLVFDDTGGETGRELELLTTSLNAFSEIRGIVYVDYSSIGLAPEDASKLVIRASDTGVCPRSEPIASDYDSSDWFVEYICYFGAGWYGNIDVVYTDSSLSSQQLADYRNLCVGDPEKIDDLTDLSRHADWLEALDSRREYRGYGLAVVTGGGVLAQSGGLIYVLQGISEGDIYGYGAIASGPGSSFQQLVDGDFNHNFMMVKKPNGNPDSASLDAICAGNSGLASIAQSSYTGFLPGGVSGSFSSFSGNYRDFVCLEINGVFSCPADVPDNFTTSVSAATYSISGLVSGAVSSGSLVSVTSQFPSGSVNKCSRDSDGIVTCVSENVCSNPDSNSYSCNVWVASGAAWSGTISHTAAVGSGLEVCSPSDGVQTLVVTASTASASLVSMAASCPTSVNPVTYQLNLTSTVNSEYDLRGKSISISGVTCTNSNSIGTAVNPWKKFSNGDSGTVSAFCTTVDSISPASNGLLGGTTNFVIVAVDTVSGVVTAEIR